MVGVIEAVRWYAAGCRHRLITVALDPVKASWVLTIRGQLRDGRDWLPRLDEWLPDMWLLDTDIAVWDKPGNKLVVGCKDGAYTGHAAQLAADCHHFLRLRRCVTRTCAID